MAGIIAVIILVSRYSGKIRLPLRAQNSAYGLKKADSLYLGYRKFISVVEVQDRVLVVGIGDKELTLLAEWKKEERVS